MSDPKLLGLSGLALLVALLSTACGGGGETTENVTPNNATPNNVAPNNATPNNATPNNATPNNATPNNATPNNATPNNAAPNNATTNNAPEGALAAMYPGDIGIGDDPAVVFHDDFEQASIDELVARYDDAKRDGLSFSGDVPQASSGSQSVLMSAGGANGAAADLFKQLEPSDHLYVRYYVKYEADTPYHHSGMWLGGYNPPTSYPSPQAGQRPQGDDRISVAVEPLGDHPMGRRMDFYNYWRGMHTWRPPGEPTNDNQSFWGNAKIHDESFYTRMGEWMCIEFMVRLNDDVGSTTGGELAVWSEDELVVHFTESGPLGYWIRDKFCPADADAPACVDYAPAPGDREQDVLDLQWRSDDALRLNWIWPQNYISQGAGELRFDDMVVATQRVGCIQ